MFKKVLLSFLAVAALAFSGAVIAQKTGALQENVATATSRTATYTSNDMFARPGDKGITVYGIITSLTSESVTFTIQAKTPQATYVDVLSSAVTGSTGTVALSLAPGITNTANVSLPQILPPVFRIKATHSATGSATYSIGVNRSVTN